MALWVIKPGRQGEHEDYFLKRDLACLTFPNMPSVREIDSSQKMKFLFLAVQPNAPKRAVINYASQAWAFRGLCRIGDPIVLPLKSSRKIVVGQVASDYRYNTAADDPYRHERDVAWSDQLIDRHQIDADLRYSFSANKTFCETRREDAELRIQELVDSESPADNSPSLHSPRATGDIILDQTEQIAWKKLKRYIEEKFSGHDLTHLFAEVLQADGYHIHVSPEGPDGGHDILAARGEFGFDGPHICVQVKRTAKPVGASVLRELLGTMQTLRATHGILVSWSGFTPTAQREALTNYFEVRLVDGDELVRMVVSRIDSFSPAMKKRLPLRRAWVFAREHGESTSPVHPLRDPSETVRPPVTPPGV